MVPAPRKYPNELRERVVRLVVEAMAEDTSLSLNGAGLADRPAGRGRAGHAAWLGQAAPDRCRPVAGDHER